MYDKNKKGPSPPSDDLSIIADIILVVTIGIIITFLAALMLSCQPKFDDLTVTLEKKAVCTATVAVEEFMGMPYCTMSVDVEQCCKAKLLKPGCTFYFCDGCFKLTRECYEANPGDI